MFEASLDQCEEVNPSGGGKRNYMYPPLWTDIKDDYCGLCRSNKVRSHARDVRRCSSNSGKNSLD